MDFDETRLYYSHQQLQSRPVSSNNNEDNDNEQDWQARVVVADGDNNEDTDGQVDIQAVRRHFREFLRTFIAWYCLNERLKWNECMNQSINDCIDNDSHQSRISFVLPYVQEIIGWVNIVTCIVTNSCACIDACHAP